MKANPLLFIATCSDFRRNHSPDRAESSLAGCVYSGILVPPRSRLVHPPENRFLLPGWSRRICLQSSAPGRKMAASRSSGHTTGVCQHGVSNHWCVPIGVRGMQVPWSVSGYAGTLTSFRGMQVPWPVSGVCRHPDQCQWSAGTLTSVNGLQVPWPVSMVCRYPDQFQGYAGTLADQCQRFKEIDLLSLWLSIFQGVSWGDFLLAPARPIEKVTLNLFLNIAMRGQRGWNMKWYPNLAFESGKLLLISMRYHC